MSQKAIILLAIVLVITAGLFIFYTTKDSSDPAHDVLSDFTIIERYDTNTVLTDLVSVPNGEALVMENSSTLTTQEPLTIDGALGCRGGSLTLVAEASLTINGTIVCQGETGADVTIVAQNGLTMAPDAEIAASGNVQIVDAEAVVRSTAELNVLYDEVATEADSSFAIGPFVDAEETLDGIESTGSTDSVNEVEKTVSWGWLRNLVPVAWAQVDNGTTTVNLTGEPIEISGKLRVETPKQKGIKRIVVFDFPNTPEVTITDFELEGPAGRVGDGDSGSCTVTGDDGDNAFRFNAFTPSLIVNNSTLTLGDGGVGGEATTGGDCMNARATGGDGGTPGNFRMIGSQNFEVRGAFTIHPGRGGAGGGATARGKDGEPGEPGGSAQATGGDGADNKKKLTVGGTVAGTSNVVFGDAVGGAGGAALAEGGAGGGADQCGMAGGVGGNASAESGAGGDAKLTVTGGAGRMSFATDIGGQGGLVEAYAGKGGAGGSCDEQKPGGAGGRGGSADATEGNGGQGKSGRASDGAMLGSDGGDGGRGGDGCTEGMGGAGGTGDIDDGQRGQDGKNICITITKEEDYISLVPGEIAVIQYQDHYIPITNLEKFTDASGAECDGEEHWHPGAGGAIETGGMAVPDPDPNNCGFGKTSEVSVLIIDDPNYSEPEEQPSGDGMIQIDPPTLVIPAG